MEMKSKTKVHSLHQLLPTTDTEMQWTLWLFVVLSSFLILWFGYYFFERLGLFLGLLVSIALNLSFFVFGKSPLVYFFQAQHYKGQDPWGLNSMIADISRQLEMPAPQLFVFESPSANAFTSGIPWQGRLIGLSSSLIKKFSQEEKKAILVYLLVQIRFSENFWVGFSTMVTNTLVGIATTIDKYWPPNFFFEKRSKPLLSVVAPLGWFIIRWARPPRRYVYVDLLASEILQDRKTLSRVLWRLEGLALTSPLQVPPCSGHLFIVDPDSSSSFFLKSHPSMKYRLEKLMGYYPI